MKRRFISAAFAGLFLFCIHAVEAKPAAASAASGGKNLITVIGSKGSAENNETPYTSITSSLKSTPRFLIDGVSYETSKQEKRNAKGWIEIIIPFKTELSKESPWLENIRVNVDVLIPVVNEQQQVEWGVLSGSALLAPVANGPTEPGKVYGYHNVRMFVSSYIVTRYVALRSDRKRFEKIVEGFPVSVTFTYENAAYTGGRPASKDFLKICTAKDAPAFPGGKLTASTDAETAALFKYYQKNRRAFFVLNDAIVPASKTPWIWFEFDKQENTIDDQQRSR